METTTLAHDPLGGCVTRNGNQLNIFIVRGVSDNGGLTDFIRTYTVCPDGSEIDLTPGTPFMVRQAVAAAEKAGW